ncbi:hypothetical protein EDB81DRAFT_762349 [Dactylonectria macrodidyma]|uniref:Uncharacterized protein n=1 Tax=Dactylonectria macrodidyma TaxID=307937 RepID=A0A9P9EAN5_9HYPO|nr:hypothetical protein EDB81DRAFT_762349 [Dactylonectria macrodidyma]
MHPVTTDAELLESFTLLEHEFKKWLDCDEHKSEVASANVRGPALQQIIEAVWPEVDNVFEQWNVWYKRWVQRNWQLYPVTEEDFKESVRRFKFRNFEDLERYILTLDTHDIDLVNLGSSNFGGIVAGYAVSVSDSPPLIIGSSEIMADINRRFKDVMGAKGFGDGPLRYDPQSRHWYLRIGVLQYCTGWAWEDVLNHDEYSPAGYRRPYREGTFEDTGYSVMVEICSRGHPSGNVVVAFDPKLEYRAVHAAPGPLYQEDGPQFLVAKIAHKLEDLKKNAEFNFEILHKCPLPEDCNL